MATTEKWPTGAPDNLQSQIKKVESGPYAGRFCISANANIDHKPTVVDQDLSPILDSSEIFAGVIANAACAVFGYDVGKPGVGWGINFLQLVRNTGDDIIRLDNSQSVEDVFAKVAGAPPVTTAQAPVDTPVQTPVDSAPPVTAAADEPWN